MKSKQVKKVLSITIASAVIASSTPSGALVVSAESKDPKETEAAATAETTEEKPVETPKEEQKPAEAPKEEEKPAEAPKEEQKPAETPKEEEKPAETPKEDQTPTETPKEEEKPAETPKEDQTPTETPKKDQTPTEAPKKDSESTKPESKEISVSWPEKKEVVWNGAEHSVTATTSEAGVTLSYTIEKDGTVLAKNVAEAKVTEPGTYTIIVAGTSTDKEIVINNPAINYTVKKATVSEFNWEGLDPEYNEGKAVALPTATFESANNAGAVNAVVAYKDAAEKSYVAGDEYEVTVSLPQELQKYYEIAASANVTATQKIQKKAIEVDWSGDKDLVYDGESKELTCTPKDYPGTGTIKISYDKPPVNAGTYTATAELSDSNYAISNSTSTKEFEIAKYDVTVKADSVPKVYGAKSVLTYSVAADNLALAGDAKGQLDKIDGGILTTVDNDENVGTHQIILKDNINLENYNVLFDTSAKAELTITQLPVVVKPVADQAKVYGEEDPESYFYTVDIPEDTKGGSTLEPGDVQDELGKTVLTREGIEGENGIDTPASEEGYKYQLTMPNGDYGNFAVTLSTDETNATFKVNQKSVDVEWSNTDLTYNGESQTPTGAAYHGTVDLSENLTYTYLDKDGNQLPEGTVPKEAGTYTVVAEISNSNYALSAETKTKEFEIKKCKVVIAAKPAEKVYGADNSFDYTVTPANDKLQDEVEKLLQAQEDGAEKILTTDGNENVGTHTIILKNGITLANYEIEYQSADLIITQLPVVVKPLEGQSKVYRADDPTPYTYTVQIPEDTKGGSTLEPGDVQDELAEFGTAVLKRAEGENVDSYSYDLVNTKGDYGNFAVQLNKQDEEGNEIQFEITPLAVTVIPESGQHKTYGENDPAYYAYDISYKPEETNLSSEAICEEIGKEVLVRDEGESPKTYKYNIRTGEDGENLFLNYVLTASEEVFTIDSVKIKEVQDINSRQGSFEVKTNIDGENRKDDVVTRVKVEAEFPESKNIAFDSDIAAYIDSADGIGFTGSDKKIEIKNASYSTTSKYSKKTQEWLGKLPAGTKLTVSIVDNDGKTVSKEAKTVTVSKVNVTLNPWTGTTAGATGNYVVANGGKVDPLTLTGSADEYVEILYSKNNNGSVEASYAKMNTTFTPSVNNSGSTHVMQSVTAGIVDTLNLTCNTVNQTFYVDDTAFPIESSAIQFENRGKEIKIRLPETGTITNVSIPGAKVETSGSQGQDFTFKVDWSGKNLIPTGTAISVTYKDQAGHEGTGTGTATRSSVSTPITFRIRPELNANGYLNGQSNTLIVSGAACSCEPIRVTAAGMSQTVNATQVDTWSDSNGSWEVMFDMNSFPEKQDFTISAEYTDVNGASHSISAKYASFVSPASIVSPIYEAMTHISGMVEPGTAVALVINGDTKKYQEIEVDRFGRLSMDDVPMMFGGEDSFDIYVQDIAGNVSISHYDIPEASDPSEVTSTVNPLGKYIFNGDKETASSYAATPISGKDFAEDKDTLELPLIMGMSYEVGKMTVKKSGNGVVVSSTVDANGIDQEDYKIENEHLYVYTSKPSADDLKKQSGKEYAYGEEISLGANDTIWLVDSKDMTILTDSIEDLELFNYKESNEYEAYQEQ